MKTQELLALWRERWEKPPQEVLLRPLTNGRLAQKLRQLALANFWQIPGLAAVCGVIFFSLASMPLTMVAQSFVSGFLCFFAVILHRQRGLVPALVITALLHKARPRRHSPDPRRSYAIAIVSGVPSSVKRLSNATRTCSSVTWRSNVRAITRSPSR